MRTEIIATSKRTENGRIWESKEVEVARFKEIPEQLTIQLLDWLRKGRKIGETVTIDGAEYVLDFVSENKNSRFRSRSLSIYFRVGRSVIRISDHWSEAKGHPRSQKLNCGNISDCYWVIDNDPAGSLIEYTWHAGQYPWELLAGKAGLAKLNKTAPHWK